MRSGLFDIHVQAGAQMSTIDDWEIPNVYTSVASEYAAAHNGAVVYDSSSLGRLRLTGRTRIDFLHRMSTNDMNALEPGQGAATVLTTPIGRIVDRVVVYVREDDAIAITSRGAQAAVAGWLKKYIFFSDDVQVHDVSTEFGMLSFHGAQAIEVASRALGQDVTDLNLHAWRAVGDHVIAARADALAGGSVHVLASGSDALTWMWQAAIASGATPIGEQTYEVLRIESGMPRYAHELSEAYIPLEVGLWSDVSFSKGCYVGQEIIARMESRQRLAKQMVGLRSRATIASGAELYAEGKVVGKVSSAAARPDGESIALGFVKPAYAAAGSRVSLAADQAAELEVTRFPIPDANL